MKYSSIRCKFNLIAAQIAIIVAERDANNLMNRDTREDRMRVETMRHLVICIAFGVHFFGCLKPALSARMFFYSHRLLRHVHRIDIFFRFSVAVLHSSQTDNSSRESIISLPTKVFSIQPVPLPASSPTCHPPRISFTLRKTSMSACRITIGSIRSVRPFVRSPESNVSRRWSLPAVPPCDKVQSNATDFESYSRIL